MTKERIPLSMPGNRLPVSLRLEIRLVACMIPLINRLCSPDQAIRLMLPSRRRASPGEMFPVDLACFLGKLLRRRWFMRKALCIRRSYLLFRYLRLHGIAAMLNFGLRGEGREQGHCWVSLDGRVLFEEINPHEEFPRLVGLTDHIVYWI